MKMIICDRCKKPIYLKEYKNGDIVKLEIGRIIYVPDSSNIIIPRHNLDICSNCSKELKEFIYRK